MTKLHMDMAKAYRAKSVIEKNDPTVSRSIVTKRSAVKLPSRTNIPIPMFPFTYCGRDLLRSF